MPQFLIAYLGQPKTGTAEENQQHMEKYRAWLSSLGEAAISPANPMKNTSTVHPDGSVTSGGNSAMSGFTIIEADSMDEAISVTKACPFLEVGGTLEVSELMQMKA